ncbi:tuberoinfundibular peptide of 39 residues [Pygocentrus nattereri]|uniref:Tuberoinfundibular peptide of 39 residues n=1 Tax=Pygocentrus nattereri TaxID=42514 RepID=A0AAR2JH59_PYGNA|nr:tuberoinfundibular peptide of 39 residues [Pygocentrus nattereri]
MEELQTSLDSTDQSLGFFSNITLWRQSAAVKQQILSRTNNSTKMVALTLPTRPTLLLTVLMSIILVTSAFPQPHLQPLPRNSPLVGQDDSKQEQWEVLYPSISLRDWSIQMLSAPDFGEGKPRTGQLGVNEWSPLSQSQVEENLEKGWPADWPQRTSNQEKRNIVVADDAAFREKSKLLTAMERQKWLNSYMQKLLVVNSK